MSVIYVLLPVALFLSTVALLAFIRAVRTGQFDDLDTPPWRILTDDDDALSQVQETRSSASQRSEPR